MSLYTHRGGTELLMGGTENKITDRGGTENRITNRSGTENKIIDRGGTEKRITDRGGTEKIITGRGGTATDAQQFPAQYFIPFAKNRQVKITKT